MSPASRSGLWAAAVSLILAACGGATSAPPSAPASASASPAASARSVHMAYATQSATSLPILIARDAGIFKSHNIDANITFSRDGGAAIAALVGGDVQFIVVGEPNLTNAVLQGADVEYLAWPAHISQLVLVSQQGVNSIADLKGKTVGVTSLGSTTDLFVEALLAKSGLDPKKDVSIVAVGTGAESLAAFTTRHIDAGVYSTPLDAQAIASGGQALFDFKTSDFTYPQSGLATTKALTKSNPSLVGDVVTSYVQAVGRLKSDRQQAVQSMMSAFSMSEKLASDAYDVANPAIDEDVTPRLADEQSILNMLAPTNPKAASAKPQEFYDDSFAKAAVQSLKASPASKA
jgi:ABC-type nitrate/sulfonate/bicarbonate transport system substrate-binding protein